MGAPADLSVQIETDKPPDRAHRITAQMRSMTPSDILTFALPIMIFACGSALLSYRFYAAYGRWPIGDFPYKSHLPGILGTALMLLAILDASSLGWACVIVAILGGFAASRLSIFWKWGGTALLGLLLAVASTFLIHATAGS